MAWEIKCCKNCGCTSMASDIVDLIKNHCDENGWFVVTECKHYGYIEKSFALQEGGEKWEPYLRGIISLGGDDDIYQPFIFMVSYESNTKPDSVWFSYYKDLRTSGGRLKLGYVPGGPPVLNTESVKHLIKEMIKCGLLGKKDIEEIISDD